jgi:hypothetical protein
MPVLVEEDAARFLKRGADSWSNWRDGLFLQVNRNKNEDVGFHLSGQTERDQREVYELDANERRDDSADAVDEKIAH